MADRDDHRSACRSCGAELPAVRPGTHACDWWRWLDHQVELRRDDLDRFEGELGAYLRTPRGRFALWDAERMRRGTI